MTYLRYLCLFTHSGVQRTLCCGLVFFPLRLVNPMLLVSLDCPFFIAPSVFSNVYWLTFFFSSYGTIFILVLFQWNWGCMKHIFLLKPNLKNLSFCFVIKSPKQILETYCFYSVFSFLFYFGDLWNSFVYLFFKMYIFSIVLYQQDVPRLNRCRFYCHMH